jgi:hypothetical protein
MAWERGVSAESPVLRARSKRVKDLLRFAKWLERRRLLDEAYWDRERCELVAIEDHPFLGVGKGEVLFDTRGYVNPALEAGSVEKALHG